VITSNAANRYQFKTGQGKRAPEQFMFYPVIPCRGKSNL
jgi:hypothetical protein